MKKIFFPLSVLIFISSCLDLKREKIKQVYPSFDFTSIQEVRIMNEKTNKILHLNNEQLLRFISFMDESKNYFPKDSVLLRGEKSSHSIKIISPKDTLNMLLFLTENSQKIELAFFEEYDSKEPNKLRKLNRFYLSSEFLKFTK